MAALLEVRDLSRSFSGLRVLNGVSFTVEQGSITGLIGPNGAGKSTLFNIVSGFLDADAGAVLYAGMQIGRLAVPRRSRLGLVRTFQTPQVFAHLSVRENLIAGCYKHTRSGMLANFFGTPGSRTELVRMQREAQAACERFGLAEVSERPAGKLPAGQQRLVELARACIGKPRLLCLDEPSSGLNSEEVAQLMQTLQRLNREGISILLVSHDMDLVTVASMVHVLCFGEIIASGPLEQIKMHARVREAYLGM
ncbi:MAG TPA: ABC transporter ATP-binding protein [Burkholderiales bacterium]|nr:ABC transporter ATP-binding protein [Burkholderiales bacterium]